MRRSPMDRSPGFGTVDNIPPLFGIHSGWTDEIVTVRRTTTVEAAG